LGCWLDIPYIYATMYNMQTDNQTSIIEMECKICDQVVSILIDARQNYRYISPDSVDQFQLNKEVHAKYWLV